MNRRKIHIGNLQIRLPRHLANDAQTVTNGLGNEILRQTAEMQTRKSGNQRIESLDAGEIRISGGVSAAALQKKIARQIAALIGENVK